MYTKVVFESAEEFFRACRRHRATTNDTSPLAPIVPSTVYVVFDGDAAPFLSGEGAEQFGLSDDISQDEMVEAAFCATSSRVHLT